MSSRNDSSAVNRIFAWILSKNQERNLISAGFHMIVVTLISMSLVQLKWFEIIGDVCTPYLTLSQFFWFGYSNDFQPDFSCINNTIINMMRIIILWCFMTIIFSLAGFFMDITGSKKGIYLFVRKYSLASTCTVLWILAIISSCYYVVILLEDSLELLFPKNDTMVIYGYGFYLVATTGGVALVGTLCSLILVHTFPSSMYAADDPCLIDDFEDNLGPLYNAIPPPPYNIPPPPYAP